jgi:hypothetical protein
LTGWVDISKQKRGENDEKTNYCNCKGIWGQIFIFENGGHLGQACIIALGWENLEPAGMHGAISTV